MTLTNALEQLALLRIEGVQQHYAMHHLPRRLMPAQLPALLILPMDTHDDGLFRDIGAGLQMAHFSGGAGRITYTLTHLLLIAPEDAAGGWRHILPSLVTTVDAYMAAWAADSRLQGTLAQPARIRAEMGSFAYGVGRTPERYLGCAFRHEWVVGT